MLRLDLSMLPLILLIFLAQYSTKNTSDINTPSTNLSYISTSNASIHGTSITNISIPNINISNTCNYTTDTPISTFSTFITS